MSKKYKKIIPAISLVFILVLLFTGCGASTLISSIFNKNTPPVTDVPPVEDVGSDNSQNYDNSSDYIDNTQQVETTSSFVVTPSTTLAPAAPAAPATTAAASSGEKKQPATTAAAKQPATTEKAAPATTAASQPETTKPIDELTEEDISKLSVHEIQNMLFDTEDPNIAGKILTLAGFAYDADQAIYYSTLNPWQRFFGFNVIYDIAAPRVGMVYDTTRIYFDYDNRDWMIQIWKGQYGITAGAEIGLYNKPKDRVVPQYACAKDEDLITMKFDLYNGGKYVFTRGPEKHWWLTGFKIFNVGISFMLEMDMTLEFPTREMALAFEKGLKKSIAQQLVDPMTYTRSGKTFNIKW